MTHIICTLRDDAVWSDGTRIKIEDIIATINTFKKNAINEDVKKFLSTVKVSKNGENVEITTSSKNPLINDILTYPIVKSSNIEAILSGSIDKKSYITSGPYVFEESIVDEKY